MECLQRPLLLMQMRTLTDPVNTQLLTRLANRFDTTLVEPQAGQIYHLAGPEVAGRSMRVIAEQWVARALSRGSAVHWIDGACRIDPSRFIPVLQQLNASLETCLSSLFLSRGFTLHQLARQIERLPSEVAITRAPLIVIDGVLCMHHDKEISRMESRSLFRRHIALLAKMVQHQHVALILITEQNPRDDHHGRLLSSIKHHSQNYLEGSWKGRRNNRMLYLQHPKSGLGGLWNPSKSPLQTQFQIQNPKSINSNSWHHHRLEVVGLKQIQD